MNSQEVEFVFQSFIAQENKLIEIFKVFPYSKENELAWSPDLGSQFLDICSFVDSVSRRMLGGDQNVGIKDFENKIFSELKLLNSKVVVYLYPIRTISPFSGYRESTGWWKIYNSLKHNRIDNFTLANLGNTLKALAALFLLLVRNSDQEISKAIYRHGWVYTKIVPESFHCERMKNPELVWYDSELFGTSEKADGIPDELDKINPILTSPKFMKFYGRLNP
jgi:hypothetical protein